MIWCLYIYTYFFAAAGSLLFTHISVTSHWSMKINLSFFVRSSDQALNTVEGNHTSTTLGYPYIISYSTASHATPSGQLFRQLDPDIFMFGLVAIKYQACRKPMGTVLVEFNGCLKAVLARDKVPIYHCQGERRPREAGKSRDPWCIDITCWEMPTVRWRRQAFSDLSQTTPLSSRRFRTISTRSCVRY